MEVKSLSNLLIVEAGLLLDFVQILLTFVQVRLHRELVGHLLALLHLGGRFIAPCRDYVLCEFLL